MCVRHPDRPTGLTCVRCERPACPDCLREASVGYQCVDCVNEGKRTVRTPATVAGAPVKRRMLATPALILVNVAVFVVTVVQAGSIVNNVTSDWFVQGALVPDLVALGDWWRIFSSGFLHFGSFGGLGPVHLLFNMFALYVLGRDLEPVLGWLRFAAVYLLALVGGSAAVMLFGEPESGVAGASGAIYGLFGGIAVVVFRMKLNMRPVLILLGVNIVLSVSLPGISLLGHLGGLIIGAGSTAAIVYAPAARRNAYQLGAVVVIALLLFAVIAWKVSNMDCSEVFGGYVVCRT